MARAALRHFRNGLRNMRPSHKVLSRVGGTQRAALASIVVVNHESNSQPHEESDPVRDWQASHQEQARNDSDYGRKQAARRAKSPWPIWLAKTKDQHAAGD